MKFKMNNRDWEIIELSQEKISEEYGKEGLGNCFGLCDYSQQKIILWKDLHEQQKKQTLIHELLHCYICCYVSFEDMEWNEDIVCNICSNSHDIIHEIVNEYFKQKKD